MRELDECKAEVFRRSEKRIKERKKKRNRILFLCISLFLIVTVWSVMIMPEMMPKKAVKNVAEGVIEDSTTSNSYVCPYTEVMIRNAGSSNDGSQRVTDKVKVARIFEMIFALGELAGERLTADEDAADQNEGTKYLTGYIITFVTEDGSEKVYALDNNELFNVDENTRIILTDSQLEELSTLLGIAD